MWTRTTYKSFKKLKGHFLPILSGTVTSRPRGPAPRVVRSFVRAGVGTSSDKLNYSYGFYSGG